jgi:hypothetical protein
MMGKKLNELWIAYEGSGDAKDWEQNFNIRKMVIPYDGVDKKVKIHSGFLDAYKNSREFVLDFVHKNIFV